MRADRRSVYAQWDRSVQDAMRAEFEQGLAVLGDSAEGVARFRDGAGRGGSLE